MEGITVYGLYPRLVRDTTCTHKACERYVNPSMATGTSYHNPYLYGDDLVILQMIMLDLGPHLGWNVTWIEDGGYTCGCIASHACEIYPMPTQVSHKK